jgi:hypothetical protein
MVVGTVGSAGGILAACNRKKNIFQERLGPFRKRSRRNDMATSKERDKEQHIAMKTPPIVSQQEWEAARQQLLVKEKA